MDIRTSLYTGLLVVASCGVPANLAAQCSSQWQAGPPYPGISGGSTSIALFPSTADGVLYFGGSFSVAGPHLVHGLAIWDNDRWLPVPGWPGLPGDVVGALLSEPERLLVARARRNPDNTTSSDILAFDGSVWTSVASGAPGGAPAVIHSIDRFEGSLWVLSDPAETCFCGGSILRWDGQAWQPAMAGLKPCAIVRRLRVLGAELVAMGDEGQLLASAPDSLARWNGSSWVPFAPSPLGGSVHDAIVHDGSPVFVGYDLFDRSRPAPQGALGSAAVLTGAGWDRVGQLADVDMGICSPGIGMRITEHQSRLAVVGYTMPGIVRIFDGANWTSGPLGAESFPSALLSARGMLWFAGAGVLRGSDGAWLSAATLDRGSATPLLQTGGANSAAISRIIATPDGVTGLGVFRFDPAVDQVTRGVARFDGQRWIPLGAPEIFSDSALASNRQGLFLLQSPRESGDRILRWSGTDWVDTSLPIGAQIVTMGSHEGALIATSGADGRLLRYDGQDWTPLIPTAPVPFESIVAAGPSNLFGIHLVYEDGTLSRRAYRLHAGAWAEPLPALPWQATPYRLVVHSGEVYLINGLLYRLNGDVWQQVATGLEQVEDAVSLRGELYAAGRGGPGVVRLAAGEWVAVDGGSPGESWAHSLAVFNGDLWAAGGFGAIGRQVSAHIAHLACGCRADFDQSGASTVDDVLSYLSAWLSGSQLSDTNGDLVLTVQDLFDFLDAYFRGCAR